MTYNGSLAANFAYSNAKGHSTQNCAKFVRQAIQWGGVTVAPTNSAKDYGSHLVQAGFYEVCGPVRKVMSS
ncbi:hypothetical protein QFZ89_000871 [Paraburkholderia youngii]